MENDYLIAWKKKANGRIGFGKNLIAKSEAQALAEQLNDEHPDFEHIAVSSDTKNVFGLFSKDRQDPLGVELHSYPGATQITSPGAEEDLVFPDMTATALAIKDGQ